MFYLVFHSAQIINSETTISELRCDSFLCNCAGENGYAPLIARLELA